MSLRQIVPSIGQEIFEREAKTKLIRICEKFASELSKILMFVTLINCRIYALQVMIHDEIAEFVRAMLKLILG